MLFYVHIGKTGGTVIKREIRRLAKVKKAKEPQVIDDKIVLLNHMSLDEAVSKFGHPSGIAFSYRNPTDRFVSGFYCRQRMGWPDHRALWDAREAAAFAHFDTANNLAEALFSDDLKVRSAAQYSMMAIRHLRRGYTFHFGAATSFFPDYSHLIKACINTSCLTTEGSHFLERLGFPGADFSSKDASSRQKPEFPRELSEKARANLSEFWEDEYSYFGAFELFATEPQ